MGYVTNVTHPHDNYHVIMTYSGVPLYDLKMLKTM